MAEIVTMADLRQTCEDRLAEAVIRQEAGLDVVTLSTGDVMQQFETPAGVTISRYLGLLSVACDFSDDAAVTKAVRVEFVDGEEEPVEVVESEFSNNRFNDQTVAKRNWNTLATELSNYVTLVL